MFYVQNVCHVQSKHGSGHPSQAVKYCMTSTRFASSHRCCLERGAQMLGTLLAFSGIGCLGSCNHRESVDNPNSSVYCWLDFKSRPPETETCPLAPTDFVVMCLPQVLFGRVRLSLLTAAREEISYRKNTFFAARTYRIKAIRATISLDVQRDHASG